MPDYFNREAGTVKTTNRAIKLNIHEAFGLMRDICTHLMVKHGITEFEFTLQDLEAIQQGHTLDFEDFVYPDEPDKSGWRLTAIPLDQEYREFLKSTENG